MASEVEVAQKGFNDALRAALNNAAAIITKDYLDSLESLKLLPPSAEDVDIDITDCGKFYKLTKLVVNREESFLKKLTTVVNVASSIDCSIATIIKSDGQGIAYYFGLLSKNARGWGEVNAKRRQADAAAFWGALTGNLPGSDLKELSPSQVQDLRDRDLAGRGKCYASVSGVVALRDEEDKSIEGYVQGIENLADALQGQRYTLVMLADPVSTSQLQVIKQGYELLHTQLAPFASSSVTINESDTLSLSQARMEGISKGLTQGVAMTQSRTEAKGRSSGVSFSGGISFILSANAGYQTGSNSSKALTRGKVTSKAESYQQNQAVTDSVGSAKTAGRSLQLTYENRSVKALLEKIDKHLARLEECESFGAFDCAAYVIADRQETALAVASNYNAIMRGKASSVQASHINTWSKPEDTQRLGCYLGSLVHPRFYQNEDAKIVVTPASVVSGSELAIQLGLPKKSVAGVTVISMSPFGRNVTGDKKTSLRLGSLYHMGRKEGYGDREQEVLIDIESLAMHTFITGSTGKGKTTAICAMLDQLMLHDVEGRGEKLKFMVIEPAKGEYKERFGGYDNVHVYGTNYKKTPLLRLNPFSFPPDIHVLEHIDRLIEIFNVCWPMYAAMPAVLKDAIERAYVVAGWDLATSECRYKNAAGLPLYPSFQDVLQQINRVMDESAYSADSKGDYKGALCTRLKALTNGLYGQLFVTAELSGRELFDENVIIDLSRTGSSETRALIMGLLVMKLQEYRLANARGGKAPLQHVTVLEEAHNILKHSPTAPVSEGANILGKAVEMLANSVAEMRAYGEGFIIADQAPGLMDRSVIRNTNTKIILGLPDLEDRELVGRAANLNEEQILEVARLKTFVAAVYQNNWLEPVLCHIDANFKQVPGYRYEGTAAKEDPRPRYLEYLLLPFSKRQELDAKYVAGLVEGVYALPIPAEAKAAFIRYPQAVSKEEVQRLRGQAAYGLFNTEEAFSLAAGVDGAVASWYGRLKEVLEPGITQLGEEEQRKVIALLTRERALLAGSREAVALYERFMEHL